MQITKRTRLKELLPLLVEKERVDTLLDQVEPYPLEKKVLSMTIGEFTEIVMDEESFLRKLMQPRERAFIALGRVKQYRTEMKQVMDYIKKFQIKQTADERQAAIGVDFPDLCARMLLTVTEFFHLKSFDEAEKVAIADWIMILRDQSTAIQYQRNYQRLMEMKNKAKRKK